MRNGIGASSGGELATLTTDCGTGLDSAFN
jgi:hypothetical protein